MATPDSLTDSATWRIGKEDVLRRLRQWLDDRDPGLVLATMEVPSAVLANMSSEFPAAGYCPYPDPRKRAAFWDAYLHERAAVLDDSIPSAYLSEMDQGLYGGILGGETMFLSDPGTGFVSSMCKPILSDLSEIEKLRFDPECPWFRRYLKQLDIFAAAGRGRWGISHLILIDGLNFVFELIGATQTYIEIQERPALVRRAMELGTEINLAVQEAYFARAPRLQDGTCSNMVQWLPGRVVSESVDPFHMTSVQYFEEWGRGCIERILVPFDGAATHIHGNGRHLLASVASVRKLKAICLGDDRGFPRAFDVLRDLRARVGDMPLAVSVPLPDFVRALDAHSLVGGVQHRVTRVPDVATANRVMGRVRGYRAD